ncbi:hypothetical protein GCK72_020737 [Caenorhabditis remanei]|uniref:Solute carrier family 40 member n=1 Tax=Caenorhabditis remanei TaxID=31234 RepID=A0A6A5GG30_CAERE|nr:hypothetical protein GCK72_020737 [Caenorhabditis remanei]KAF1754177.1 hypothetical protein GCK72_020737 [Caenorhabditis remanei]
MATFILLKDSPPSGSPLLYLSIFLCAINRLFLNAEKSIISRDWVVALNHESALARQNATLTGFDQLLNVLSPVVVGTLITSYGIHQTLIIFAIGSMVSLILKSTFLYFTYTSNPCLQIIRNHKHYKIVSGSDCDLQLLEESGQNLQPPGVFSTYYRQTTFCASLGMALFYKTVMGFDNLAVGYATTSSKISIFTIGALKSYGAVAGMAGVISYTFLETRFGLIRAGYVGLVVQQVFSLLAVTTIWMPGSPFLGRDVISEGPSISIFLVAIASSRFGLWCLDMAVTHSMQLHVPESEINTVFGFHMALCQTFSVPKEIIAYDKFQILEIRAIGFFVKLSLLDCLLSDIQPNKCGIRKVLGEQSDMKTSSTSDIQNSYPCHQTVWDSMTNSRNEARDDMLLTGSFGKLLLHFFKVGVDGVIEAIGTVLFEAFDKSVDWFKDGG